jgi:hypothetical protein
MWQQCGKPNRGQQYEVMKYVRNKYHYAVRKAKKMSDSIRAQNLLEKALAGDTDLLKEMKRVKQKAACPDNVDDAHGADEVSELFKTVYEDLYNSAESIHAMHVIKTKLQNMIGPNCMIEVNKVTGAAVKEVCSRMKPES